MNGLIGILDWDGCDICTNWSDEEGCKFEEHEVTVTVDAGGVYCDDFEEKISGI